jgi:hypothetical protein
MADQEHKLEYVLNLDPSGFIEGAERAINKQQDLERQFGTGAPTAAAASAAGGGSFESLPRPVTDTGGTLPPPPQPTTDPGRPSQPLPPPPQPTTDPGTLGDFQQRVQAVQAIAPNAPDVANMAASRLQTSILHASLKDPDSAKDYQDLINSLRELRNSLQEDGKKKDGTNDLLGWMKNLAIMQTATSVGSSIAGNAMQGNIGAAAGGAVGAGIGGLLGMLGGPAGMMTGLGVGASIGSGIGGMVDRLVRGADQSLAYETQIADINQRFGVGNVGRLRNFELGTQNGFRVEETAGLIDQLRENRALSNPAMAGPLVNTIQELTRALGLNVEATANMAGIYSRTGGEKGAEGVRSYLSDVVGGAIRAGFESNIQQYADMMGSARMQAVQQTGQGMSDRAFGLLQDVMAGLTGGNSRTSALFRDNVQMAGAGLQSFLSYGGTADPYGTSAAYLRLAGVDEAALDSRFNSPEQMMSNAQRVLRMTTNRVQGISGMGADEFRAAAASDPNFVQNLIAGNSGLQRQTSATLQGILGRQATAQDLRTFEELANISAANGGRLPTGPGGDGGRVEQLLAQLQESPGDQARKLEAEAHNLTIQAMSNLNEASLKMKETQVELLEQLNGFPLKEIGDGIAAAMDNVIKFIREAGPQLANLTREGIAAFHKLRDMVNGFKESAIGKAILGGNFDGQAIREQAANAIISPGGGAVMGGAAGAIVGSIAGPVGTVAGGVIGGAIGAGVGWVGSRLRDFDRRFNDTPGTVTAAPGYNVFEFAPGDVVSARMGGTSGGATLTDIFQVLRESNLMDIQAYQTASEQRKLLQDVTNDILKTDLLIHVNSEINTQRQLPSIIQMMQAFFPQLISAVDSVREALVSTLNSVMGGAGGGGGGVGGVDASAAADIVNAAKGWEGEEFKRGVEAQCAFFVREVFKQAGRDVGVRRGSSPGLAGSFFDESVGELRHTLNPDEIPAGAIVGFENTYPGPGSGIGGFTHVGIAVGDGQMIDRSTRSAPVRQRPITTFPVDSRGGYTYIIPHSIQSTQPAAGGGGSVNLSTGYESLEQLSGQLTSLDPRFNTNTPDGRAALAIALAIGGTEVYGRGATGTDFFTRRGGTGNNMLGFAQFNLGFHRANTDTPGEYTDFLADILTGDRAQPNGRRARNWSAELSRAVQSGQIGSGAELQQWLRRSGLGGSNWQGIDDGWSRVPGLPDRLFQMLRGGDNRQASSNRTTNITVNIASATDPARTRQEVTNAIHAARPYLDEFEQTRQGSRDRNPRNSGNLSPVYG